jgi:16S rRNA (guanine966-N2)-methyltransferase
MTKQTPRRSHRPTAVNVGADPVAAARKVARTAAQEVRILGGQWKRTPLPVPVSAGLRPTPSRVRETLFNWLGQDLSGWRILDAFAGTGALGLEAASRGADEVCLLEREPALVRALLATPGPSQGHPGAGAAS